MKTLKEMLAEANAAVKTVPASEAMAMLKQADVTFIDLRDSAELEKEGMIPGAVHANRGMLEFQIEPTNPNHNPIFASGRKLLFYCKGGGRGALATATAQSMGLTSVCSLGGGFDAWKAAGGAVVAVRKEQ